MQHFDLFEFYRFMLAVLAGTYTTIRLLTFIWGWQGAGGQARVGSAVVYRYLVVLLLRTRIRRFVYEIMVIGGLLAVLVLLLRLHWW